MLDAFDIVRLVDKLPLKICAIATWREQFMISTVSTKNEAHLLVYKVVSSSDFDRPYEAKLDMTLKKFTPKPIISLSVIPEQDMFLALTTDGEFHCANLITYQIVNIGIPRLKGCSTFAVDWHRLKGFNGYLRICIVLKKKLLVYTYFGGTFTQTNDLVVLETPKMVSWLGEGIIFCIKKDLYYMTLDGSSRELFSIGQHRSEPCVLPIMRGDKQEMLVLNDDKQISLDTEAKPTQPSALVWSENPVSIIHIHPYIIGMLPRSIEIRALEQKLLVQSIKTNEQIKDHVRFIAHDQVTLVASHTQVYKLEPKAYEKQVQQCVLSKQFELALEISELIKETESERKLRREEILRRYAFYLFTRHEFEKSLKFYLEINEDPMHVIALYPHFLPSEHRQNLSLPTSPPTFTGEDLKKATEFLIKYLTQLRYLEQQNLQQLLTRMENKPEESPVDCESKKKIDARLLLIDTTLLKCYIKTGNNTLIGSLVRLPENHLHLGESERVLRNDEKFQELVQLYQTKGQHKLALTMLHSFHGGPNSSLSGVWPTIDYLQNLGSENIELILKYSEWVLQESPDDGIKIFTEEIGEVEALPRSKVLAHLGNIAPALRIQYLEHIIQRWKDTTPEFHNELILIYMNEIVNNKLPQYLKSIRGRPRAKAGEEPGELGYLRSRLLHFLQSSKYYEPEGLISRFPQDDLFEEKALLLGRLGRHEIALALYAHVLKDPKMAEEYCRRTYDPEENRGVYLDLIKTYLNPPTIKDIGISLEGIIEPVKDINTAMTILATYHEKIDTAAVMLLLPEDVSIQDIKQFLTTVLEENMVVKRRAHVLQGLQLAEHLQIQKSRIKEQAPCFVIDDFTNCKICSKKLGTSAFARYTNGDLAHLFCYQQEMDKQIEY
ncbi:PREDICTED: vam6/Vps39-like protein [Amphimedon queenslandica]|uniref:CNH domain-containing protein n=1 Tax=Amphimedon queenslandica TaxID=400682 RepID=A0A1X7UXQ1_AMPQE|nr:PREDICTED: vam6/Vps39-like protein [Amphimedon queenslandica]|eukprot:XP_019851602.1 PREDICTED: vam6/Vps39-like protein [Amphimedon queenslandica]